ncbi:MAG: Sugar phosphate isomerases/epimerases [uncultured Thermoleophilia bacterium]|uniref:Sugar phosphate isomerases/epimerases n=1 Tax=uncultured Thermoleophilia bacterium TaxID=1497501 RepID=A0A6J4TTU1_9ACTN|nr:MAG: Sugar phosphate isomerases/epimerases [uncultured Thermoleophilia bacterium]
MSGDPGRPVGLQLWTVRERCATDFAGTMEAVAALGLAGVEHVDSLRYGGLPVAEVRRRCDALGLAAAGLHVELDVLEDDLDRVLSDGAELGTDRIVCSWVRAERRADADAYREMAGSLEGIGERCRAAGRRLLYHHHDFELAPLGDGHGHGLEILRDGTTRELVGFELDVYWLAVAGHDPVEHLRAAGARAPLVHLKDVAAEADAAFPHGDGLADRNTEVGTGILDLPAILAASAATAEWYLVEQDFCRADPLESARISLQNLRAMQTAAPG